MVKLGPIYIHIYVQLIRSLILLPLLLLHHLCNLRLGRRIQVQHAGLQSCHQSFRLHCLREGICQHGAGIYPAKLVLLVLLQAVLGIALSILPKQLPQILEID